mmetsp:Transcript_11048/g.32759  ORF Transcript_11048/g.32759 Transcript_11048/m.32759 type:complete len:107 (+) Transcript_11048:1132-1452(+)
MLRGEGSVDPPPPSRGVDSPAMMVDAMDDGFYLSSEGEGVFNFSRKKKAMKKKIYRGAAARRNSNARIDPLPDPIPPGRSRKNEPFIKLPFRERERERDRYPRPLQ